MTDHILAAYAQDRDFRRHGPEMANRQGCQVAVTELAPGTVYADDRVTVEAIPVSHGALECYAYKFVTEQGSIFISGDTAPLELVAEKAAGCDILLHEVEYTAGIRGRTPRWQAYHRAVHTLSRELAQIAQIAQPGLLVTYHRIYHMEIQDNTRDVRAEAARRDAAILQELRAYGYTGQAVSGNDLDVFPIH